MDFQCELRTISLLSENLQPKPICGWELVVAPVSATTRDQEISEVFSPFGWVRSVNTTRDIDGQSKGVCLVEMAHRVGAEAVMLHLQGHEIRGRPLKIDWSTKVKQEMGLLEGREDSERDRVQWRRFEEAAQPTLSIGQAVIVSGLQSAPHLNGCIGRVIGFRGTERCDVAVESVPGVTKTVALKLESLTPARAPNTRPPWSEQDVQDNSGASGLQRRFRETGTADATSPQAMASLIECMGQGK